MNQFSIESPKRRAESSQGDSDCHSSKRLATNINFGATADLEPRNVWAAVDGASFAQQGPQREATQLDASLINNHTNHSPTAYDTFAAASHSSCGTETGQDNICFGMLPGIEIQIKWPSTENRVAENLDGVNFLAVILQLESTHGLIYKDGRAVGVLHNSAFNVLSSCVTRTPTCGIFAWVLASEWVSCMAEAKDSTKLKKGLILKIDLVLFGPRSSGDNVAVDLGSRRYYLQEPHQQLCPYPYENPQSLKLPSTLTFDALETSLDVERQISYGLEQDEDEELIAQAMPDGSSTQLNELIQNIDSFLELLPAKPITASAGSDSRIISKLFSHQNEAVGWILQREEHTLGQNDSKLWEMSILPSGELCYQHAITGAKSRNAKDFKGGILADDMGLGKTFTTLAAIVSTLDRASEFAVRSKTSAIASRATLVVVPSELLLNTWANEIERHFYPGSVRYVKYHASGRRDLVGTINQQDVVLTTYGTIMADRRGANSIIHRINWFRLVLDEGKFSSHLVRNWGSKQFNAVHSISSHIRWCLTGTPIQNSLDDLGALIRFLKMPIFSEPATFRRYVGKLKRDKVHPQGAFANLGLILSNICLRRNKDIMPLSQGQVYEYRKPEFTPREREQYHALELACKRAIAISGKRTSTSSADGDHHTVMEALLRLRIFCNNGATAKALDLAGFMTRGNKAGEKSSKSLPDEVLSFMQQRGEAMCYYCSVGIIALGPSTVGDDNCGTDVGQSVATLTRCWHLVCSECVQQYRSGQVEGQVFACPLCNGKHGSENVFDENIEPSEPQLGLQTPAGGRLRQYPSKITALVKDVRDHSLTDKCVVFSFWKKSLDIVGSALEASGVKYLRVDGSVSPKKRGNILLNFQTRQACTVLLITFSTGAVGLNGLTVANRVHILEPQWNPAAEKQAIGRLLRLDQSRKVTIVRYAMEKSIEQAVQKRQLRKLQLAGGGFSKQLSVEERRALKSDQLQELQAYFDSEQSEDVMQVEA
ncbi:hypothetical protein MCOR02_001211 [Pyricularia oryzae]|nr:hypothetical protein MCOR02_001211 [Pyricularia oryzae]KAI6550904.1 hypothetical protein MCOR03_009190 [Pyricularia oryzae]KAI6641288.1 hypothetical protein MCOR14_003015 [Pyricularia oryzae]